jgi:hypothetical protein
MDNPILANEYQPIIHFKYVDDPSVETISIEFEGGTFFVRQYITSRPGKYQIIYSLRERMNPSESGSLPGNVGDQDESSFREVFISNIFTGEVQETLFTQELFDELFGFEDSNIDVLDEIQDYSNLKKPPVKIGLGGEENNLGSIIIPENVD